MQEQFTEILNVEDLGMQQESYSWPWMLRTSRLPPCPFFLLPADGRMGVHRVLLLCHGTRVILEANRHEAGSRYGLRWPQILVCLRSPEASLLQDVARPWMELTANDDGGKAPQRADIVESLQQLGQCPQQAGKDRRSACGL